MVSQEPVITSIILMITEACNLRCGYCYLSHRPRRIGDRTVDRVLDFMFSQGSRGAAEPLSLCFFGGEPLLEPDLVADICDRALERASVENRRIGFSMTTNGTLLDQYRADLINRFRIRVNLSLDGAGEAQDLHRKLIDGSGSFRLIQQNLAHIKQLRQVSVRLTVSPETASLLEQSVHWLIDNGFRSIFFSPVVEADWTAGSLASLHSAYVALHAWQKRKPRREAKIRNLSRDFDRLRKGHSREYGCGAARTLAAIDTGGNIYPCQRFAGYFRDKPEYRIGTVFDGLDHDRRARFISHNLIENSVTCGSGIFREHDRNPSKHCGHCLLFPVCHAGCMAVNAAVTGNPGKPSPVNRMLAQVAASSCISVFGEKREFDTF